MSFGLVLSLVGVVGVALGVVGPWFSVAGALATALGLAACALAAGRGLPRTRRFLLWGTLAALALAHGAQARDRVLNPDISWLESAEGDPFPIEGTLRRDGVVTESGVRLDLDVTRVRPTGVWLPADLRVMVSVGGELALAQVGTWTAGSTVRLPTRLRIPAVTRNPGSPSVRWQVLTRPNQAIGSTKSGALVEATPGAPWHQAAAAVRAHVRRVASRWLTPLGAQTSAVVAAILIGDRAGLDGDVVRRLQKAGTFHVIAISGGNVAMLTVLGFFMLRLMVRGERIPTVVTLVLVLAYGMVVGREASVVRAVLAASLYLSLRLTALVPSAINVLAVTALLCALADPMVVVDVGAWLSFGATLGLIVILPRLMALGTQGPKTQVPWRIVRGLFLATLSAEIAIMPMAASVFMRVGAAGLLLNFVAIPAMTIVQISGLVLCVVAVGWPGGAALMASVAHWATTVLIGSASVVDIAPWLSWRVPAPSIGWVLAYYAALILSLAWRGRRSVTRSAAALAVVCALVISADPLAILRRPPAGWLRVTMLDVGQGDAISLQLPDGRRVLVDAGGSIGTFDVGGRVVTPALMALGVHRLDWLALTHGDIDHVGGARRVADDMRPIEMWEGVPVPLHVPLLDLRRDAHRRGVAWRRLRAGDQVELGPVMLDVLHPPVPDWERRKVRNDDSLVLQLRFGQVEILLTGDAGPEFESTYMADDERPPIRVLKVAHHGSRSSSTSAFLDRYAPSVAVVSAGQNNLFGHPSPLVLDRLRQHSVSVFRTDREGAVVIETDGRTLRVQTMTGRALTVTAQVASGSWSATSARSTRGR
ncbi:MAG: DNA internalization-related competence protein ComEC/Rec2 [Acidobacteria bacterium]|nr:DNA internalization-related competence protein ComEC/Rec2 [Acidobacteriota bacterium]